MKNILLLLIIVFFTKIEAQDETNLCNELYVSVLKITINQDSFLYRDKPAYYEGEPSVDNFNIENLFLRNKANIINLSFTIDLICFSYQHCFNMSDYSLDEIKMNIKIYFIIGEAYYTLDQVVNKKIIKAVEKRNLSIKYQDFFMDDGKYCPITKTLSFVLKNKIENCMRKNKKSFIQGILFHFDISNKAKRKICTIDIYY